MLVNKKQGLMIKQFRNTSADYFASYIQESRLETIIIHTKFKHKILNFVPQGIRCILLITLEKNIVKHKRKLIFAKTKQLFLKKNVAQKTTILEKQSINIKNLKIKLLFNIKI